MLNRLSVAVLIKATIGLLAVPLVLVLAFRVWADQQELAATRLAQQVVETSQQAFTVMIALRADRTQSSRTWSTDQPPSAGALADIRKLRQTDMPALASLIDDLEGLGFDGKAEALTTLKHAQSTLVALQREYDAGIGQPKASRRAALANEYVNQALNVEATLAKASANLFVTIKHISPFINEMMEVKELAWTARMVAGQGSFLISDALVTGKLPADARLKDAGYIAGAEAIWNDIGDIVAGVPLPAKFTQALTADRQKFFAPDYLATRQRLLTQLINNDKPEMTPAQFSPWVLPYLDSTLDLATAALAASEQRAAQIHNEALTSLVVQGGLLLMALLLAGFVTLTIRSRVSHPLGTLRDAMMRLAEGDLSAETNYEGRQDEIGALAGALAVFRRNAVDKAAIEAKQHEQQALTLARQQTVDSHIGTFEADVRVALDTLGGASAQMNAAADAMSAIATSGNEQANLAAGAAEDASNGVAGIAATSEELSASIAEINRRATQATEIAKRAVEETRRTDETVQSLAENAGKIGEIVRLINNVAGQTNLLALNATIEAARAGEAGRGFAVVASEVKSLANQTGKATEEIAAQIAAVQNATETAVQAIKQIGGTIKEVSAVASAIAAAVEEQGAATAEIARNTHQAASRTRDLSQTVASVREGADMSGSTARSVKTAADALATSAEQLRGRVDGFLEKIRAA